MNEAAKQTRTVGGRPARLTPVPDEAEVVPMAGSAQVITVLPTEVDLNIYQGDDFYLDMTVVDINSQPVNVTNMQPTSQIRNTPDGPAILATLSCTVDATTTNLIHIHLASSDSTNLPPTCAWDIQLGSPSVITLAAGAVNVTPQVTQ